MILKYDEALERSENKEWFKSFFKKEDLCSDEEVDVINNLVNEVGEDKLFSYFEIKEDMVLQKYYYDDLLDYLEDLIDEMKSEA